LMRVFHKNVQNVIYVLRKVLKTPGYKNPYHLIN